MNSTDTPISESDPPKVQGNPRTIHLNQYGGQITFPDAQAAIELLRSFYDEDEDEQHETLEYLKRALDEDRPGYRKLLLL